MLEADARGSVTLEKRGPTFLQRRFDPVGRLIEQKAGASIGGTSVQHERYAYDLASNLDFRERVGSFKGRFAYDGADRLTRSWHEMLGGVSYGAAAPAEDAINAVESMRFDAFGNLCFQRSSGYAWAYGGRAGCGTSGLPGSGNSGTQTGTHQAQELRIGATVIPIQFDANGNQSRALQSGAVVKGWDFDGDDRATAVWKGASSATATRRTRFENGAGGERVRRVDEGSTYGLPRATRYFGNVERINRNGVFTWRRTIAGIAVQTFTGATPVLNQTRFLWQDLLGSQVAVTDSGGSVIERTHFSVYGVRLGGQWFGSGVQTTERGFTNHEQVDDLETTHMNARVFDPTAGRFLQPDPLVQDVYRPQNWNPYAYAFNNPLRYTDPTGMFNLGRALQRLGTVFQVASIFIPGLRLIMPMVNQFLTYANVAVGFAQGGLRGGLAATFSAVAGGGSGWGGFARGLIVGGTASVIAGGKFKQGLQGALMSQAVGAAMRELGSAYQSRQTGGKQSNGAETDTQRRASRARPGGDGERRTFTLTVEAQKDFSALAKRLHSHFDEHPAPTVRDAAFVVGDALRRWTERYGAEAGANIVRVRGGFGVADLVPGTPWNVPSIENEFAYADVHTHPIGTPNSFSGYAYVTNGGYEHNLMKGESGDIGHFVSRGIDGYAFRGGDGAVLRFSFAEFRAARDSAISSGGNANATDYVEQLR